MDEIFAILHVGFAHIYVPVDRNLVNRPYYIICFGPRVDDPCGGERHLQFESDPLSQRDDRAPAVRVVEDIIDSTGKVPTPALLLIKDRTDAARLAIELAALSTVDRVVSLFTYLPENQDDRLFDIEDLGLLLGPAFYDDAVRERLGYSESLQVFQC